MTNNGRKKISPEDIEALQNDRTRKGELIVPEVDYPTTDWGEHDCMDGECTHIDGLEDWEVDQA